MSLRAVFEQAGWLDESELGIILEPTNRNLELGCQGVINARVSFVGTVGPQRPSLAGRERRHQGRAWLQAMGERANPSRSWSVVSSSKRS